jgi:starch synthase
LTNRELNVVFVSAEVAPFAKVGGLADVAGSLPKALAALGHRVTVCMPAYQMVLDDPRWEVSDILARVPVEINCSWKTDAWVRSVDMEGVSVLLIGGGGFFEKSTSSEAVYGPGIDQYVYFCHSVLGAIDALELSLDIVHCNDWQTGLIPVLMREKATARFRSIATAFTIHNLAYQGEVGIDVLDVAGLPRSLFNLHQMEAWGSVNFLKSGCAFSDQVNTVSPTYSREIQTWEYGCGLEGLMRHLASQDRLSGILNGIDLGFFNPESDPALPANFSGADISGKALCKSSLQAELDMPVNPSVPVLGIVSRLSTQKGLDLVLQIAPKLAAMPAQLVVQGLGDPKIAEGLRDLQARFPNSIRFVQAFDPDLAQRVYAGSDMFLMPSAFEPCGLGQMIAMRYGTVPVVRKTGGLADTVFDGENGFVFSDSDPEQLLHAVQRAVGCYQSDGWLSVVSNAFNADHSWKASAQEYEALYRRAISASRSLG